MKQVLQKRLTLLLLVLLLLLLLLLVLLVLLLEGGGGGVHEKAQATGDGLSPWPLHRRLGRVRGTPHLD